MQKIRIHKDITLRWRITTNGEAVSLQGRCLSLILTDSLGNKIRLPFAVTDTNLLTAIYEGRMQRLLGKYSLTLFENQGKAGENAVDSIDAFMLVASTDEESEGVSSDISAEALNLSGDMATNLRGASAYEVWLMSGHEGTEEDFLNWLRPKVTVDNEGNILVDGNKESSVIVDTITALNEAESQRNEAESQRQETFDTNIEGWNQRVTDLETYLKDKSVITEKQDLTDEQKDQVRKNLDIAFVKDDDKNTVYDKPTQGKKPRPYGEDSFLFGNNFYIKYAGAITVIDSRTLIVPQSTYDAYNNEYKLALYSPGSAVSIIYKDGNRLNRESVSCIINEEGRFILTLNEDIPTENIDYIASGALSAKGLGAISFLGIADGQNSVALCQGVAQGDFSLALHSLAKGNDSFAVGMFNQANGNKSAAFGQLTKADGLCSFVNGDRTEAKNRTETAIGSLNVSHQANTTKGDGGNTLFSVGCGWAETDKKNAIEVMQNGDVYAKGIGDYDGKNLDTAKPLQTVLNETKAKIDANAEAVEDYGFSVVDGMLCVTYEI